MSIHKEIFYNRCNLENKSNIHKRNNRLINQLFKIKMKFLNKLKARQSTWVSPVRRRCCPSLLVPSSCLNIARSTLASVGESRIPGGILLGREQRVIPEGPTLCMSECTSILF